MLVRLATVISRIVCTNVHTFLFRCLTSKNKRESFTLPCNTDTYPKGIYAIYQEHHPQRLSLQK